MRNGIAADKLKKTQVTRVVVKMKRTKEGKAQSVAQFM